MPIYDMYPYTNLHELNLDALIKLYKDFKAEIDGWEALFHGLETCFTFDDDNQTVTCAYDFYCNDIYSSGIHGVADAAMRLNRSGMVGSPTEPVYFNDGVPVRCNGTLDVDISGEAATALLARDARSAEAFNEVKTINLTGDVTGTVTTNFYSSPINIATTVVNGGSPDLPETIFEDTVQGVQSGALYIFQFDEPLELCPQVHYAVDVDGVVEEALFEYANSYGGYAMAVNNVVITYAGMILLDGDEHAISIKALDHVTKQLLFAGDLTFQDSGQGFYYSDDFLLPRMAQGEYTIVWDGTTYNLTSEIDSNIPSLVIIGSYDIYSGTSGDYPFAYIMSDALATLSTSGSHHVEIFGPALDSDHVILYADAIGNWSLNDRNFLYYEPELENIVNPLDAEQILRDKVPVIYAMNGPTLEGCFSPVNWLDDVGNGDLLFVVSKPVNNSQSYWYWFGVSGGEE